MSYQDCKTLVSSLRLSWPESVNCCGSRRLLLIRSLVDRLRRVDAIIMIIDEFELSNLLNRHPEDRVKEIALDGLTCQTLEMRFPLLQTAQN